MAERHDLCDRLFRFAVNVILYLRTVKNSIETIDMKRQLIKASTSSGANYEESQGTPTKPDFKNKIGIFLREMRESNYFLRIFHELKSGDNKESKILINESAELKKILRTILGKLTVFFFFFLPSFFFLLFSSFFFLLSSFFFLNSCFSQNLQQTLQSGEIHGNFQMDAQYYNPDSLIGAPATPEKMLLNGFSNIIYTNQNFSAGVRYESYLNALQGFPPGYKGSGFPYRFASFSNENLTVTVGNFYEQFGSGLIFRSYEERGLGLDNAMDGFRLNYKIYKGINTKAMVGKKRKYFAYGEGIVRGADLEFNINEIFDSLQYSKTRFTFGGSFVSKYQKDQNSTYVLPENVSSFAGRANLIHGGFNLFGEYVYKMNDPYPVTGDGIYNYNYKTGEALLVQANYSQKGFGVSLAAKRVDNMLFMTDRDANLTLLELQMNYLPALTRQHTYNLLATLYPYASQPKGEMGLQGELVYKFKKESLIGGKYGANILINYSIANNIDTIHLNDMDTTRIGYKSNFFEFGKDVYFKDFNLEFSKKFTAQIKATFTYSNIAYNMDVIQGKVNYGIIYADIGVMEIDYKISKKHSLRTEFQGLFTKQDQRDWATGIIEYSYAPHWFVAVMDQYNYGNNSKDINGNYNKRIHYYLGSVGYSQGTTRFIVNYGKQRAGIFCVGGVCRNVPASNGISMTIISSF